MRLCLNTMTCRPYGLPLPDLVRLAAKAGFAAVEPWMDEIEAYRQAGGRLADLCSLFADLGLAVSNVISFPNWLADGPAIREPARSAIGREMEVVRELGVGTMSAPPVGLSDGADLELDRIVECYRVLCALGAEHGVMPLLEPWASSPALGRLAQALYVTASCDHDNAGLLLDVYHLHKAGSGFAGLRLLNGAAMPVFHINDYPADPPRGQLRVRHRVLPGDGVAPLQSIVQSLRAAGFRGDLSLELFPDEPGPGSAEALLQTAFERLSGLVDPARP
jgi:sugar phosphate isomerase/epimerase